MLCGLGRKGDRHEPGPSGGRQAVGRVRRREAPAGRRGAHRARRGGAHDRTGPVLRRAAGDLRHRRRLVPHVLLHPLVDPGRAGFVRRRRPLLRDERVPHHVDPAARGRAHRPDRARPLLPGPRAAADAGAVRDGGRRVRLVDVPALPARLRAQGRRLGADLLVQLGLPHAVELQLLRGGQVRRRHGRSSGAWRSRSSSTCCGRSSSSACWRSAAGSSGCRSRRWWSASSPSGSTGSTPSRRCRGPSSTSGSAGTSSTSGRTSEPTT